MQAEIQKNKHPYFGKPYQWLTDTKVSIVLWFGLSLTSVIIQAIGHDRFNNFVIFRYVFFHTLQQTNLYLEYPQTYADVNLYGPFFSIVIAPFAVLPKI
ncbi:MAG: hypothetical protein EO766_15170 [Hydrotalea sp. AMD]|nr:hypothetical protein [Hydrotalea sp. AMD]RWZ86169.1 MAG: hypothetical protein EO766_15170 [Hydrotalea sp. AMD]